MAVIDGSHIYINAPLQNKVDYLNRKHRYTILLHSYTEFSRNKALLFLLLLRAGMAPTVFATLYPIYVLPFNSFIGTSGCPQGDLMPSLLLIVKKRTNVREQIHVICFIRNSFIRNY